MAKQENRLDGVLAKLKIDLAGVDLSRARSKTKGVRFLSTAVREALEGVPRVVDMTDAERASIVAWLERNVMGKQANMAALASACNAAITALAMPVNEARRTATVTAGDTAEAMKRALLIRKKRGQARKSAASKSV